MLCTVLAIISSKTFITELENMHTEKSNQNERAGQFSPFEEKIMHFRLFNLEKGSLDKWKKL